MKYILTSDGDGHWYVIPAAKKSEFSAAVEAIGNYWDRDPDIETAPPELPSYAVAVGGSPGLVEFTGYTIR